MNKKIFLSMLFLVATMSFSTTAIAEKKPTNNTSAKKPSSDAQFARPLTAADLKLAEEREAKSKADYEAKDQIYRDQEKKLVNNLLKLNYRTQNPPKQLYDRKTSQENTHLPPVYFKSYYLSLAFDAVERNDQNALRAILGHFDFLNGQNNDGDTVLMHAVQHRRIDSARILLAKGAYLDAINNRHRTALHYAAALGDLELIKLLLSFGADFTLKDDHEMTALDYAHSNESYEAVAMINQYIKQNTLQ